MNDLITAILAGSSLGWAAIPHVRAAAYFRLRDTWVPPERAQ